MGLRAFQTLLRLVYPPRCTLCGTLVESEFGLCGPCWRDVRFIGGLVCDLCGRPLPGEDQGEAELCDECLVVARPWRRGRAVFLYRDNGRKLVLAFKYRDRQDIARAAAPWLARAAAPLVTEETLVVPVPLHWSRMLRRRFNQSALLGRALARRLGLKDCPDLLVRPVRTQRLEGLSFEERFAALDGAIIPNRARKGVAEGRSVLLIDDVMTSGATLSAAAQACFAAGARDVCILVLARVAGDD